MRRRGDRFPVVAPEGSGHPRGERMGTEVKGSSVEAPSLELVLKRNPVERLKREKSPLGMLDELPALIAAGYADVAEEDVVRLKWWGLYHDKPKVGTFMLRIKLAAGRLTPAAAARRSASSRSSYGKGDGGAHDASERSSSTTSSSPRCREVFEQLHAARPDDRRRLRRRRARNSPAARSAGVAARRAVRRDARARRGDAFLLRQPGLRRPAAQAQDLDLRLRRTAATRRRSTASRSSA